MRQLEAEPRDEAVTKQLEEAAAQWQGLIDSAGNICAYCRKPFPVEEMKVHARTCADSPVAAELKELRAFAVEYRDTLARDLDRAAEEARSAAEPVARTIRAAASYGMEKLARITKALGGG